jgi:hypothetical protein
VKRYYVDLTDSDHSLPYVRFTAMVKYAEYVALEAQVEALKEVVCTHRDLLSQYEKDLKLIASERDALQAKLEGMQQRRDAAEVERSIPPTIIYSDKILALEALEARSQMDTLQAKLAEAQGLLFDVLNSGRMAEWWVEKARAYLDRTVSGDMRKE